MAPRKYPALAGHVGLWLKAEIVEPSGVSVATLARHFGVSRQGLSALLNGHASLTADMAIRFEKAFGVKADTLLRMQTTYDLAQARANEGEIAIDRLLSIAGQAAALVKEPYADHGGLLYDENGLPK